MFDLVVLGRASASASVTGVSLTDAPATDPITGVIVYYKGDSQPVTTWPGQAAPVAAAAVYFTQGADDPGAFYPFDGTVVFYALPTPAAGVAYVIDVYQASDCTLPAPPLPTDSFSGCSWDLVSENNAVTFAPGEQTGTYTPGQAEWNGVFVLHTVPTASAPAPPAPVKASGNTYDPTATSVVSAAVDTDWTYSFVTTGTDLITVTSVTYPTGAQPPVGFNNLPSSTVVGAVGLYLTQGSSAYTPANGTISFNNIPSLTSKRRSLLAVSHVYTVDFYAATGCQPAMPPVNATAFFGCSWTVSRDLPVTYDPTREKAIFAPGTSGLWNGLYLLHAILAPNPPPAQTDAPTPTPTSPPAMPAPTDTPSPGVAIGGTDRKTVLGMGLAIGLGGALFIAAAFAYVSRVRAEAAEAAVATSPPLVSQDDGLPRGSSQEPFEVDAPPFPMPEHAPLEWGESSAGAYEAALEGEAVYVADGGDAGGAYPAGDEGPPEGLRTHPISPKREATLSPAQDGSADPALEQDVPLDDSTLRRRSRTAGSVFDDFGA